MKYLYILVLAALLFIHASTNIAYATVGFSRIDIPTTEIEIVPNTDPEFIITVTSSIQATESMTLTLGEPECSIVGTIEIPLSITNIVDEAPSTVESLVVREFDLAATSCLRYNQGNVIDVAPPFSPYAKDAAASKYASTLYVRESFWLDAILREPEIEIENIVISPASPVEKNKPFILTFDVKNIGNYPAEAGGWSYEWHPLTRSVLSDLQFPVSRNSCGEKPSLDVDGVCTITTEITPTRAFSFSLIARAGLLVEGRDDLNEATVDASSVLQVRVIEPAPASFAIESLRDALDLYNPNTYVGIGVKAVEKDGTAAQGSEGFVVKGFLFDDTNTEVDGADITVEYYAPYEIWQANFTTPGDTTKKYRAAFVLTCRDAASTCAAVHGTGLESRKEITFSLIGESYCSKSTRGEYLCIEQKIIKVNRKISLLEQEVIAQAKALVTRVDVDLTKRLKGKILLQVEESGEAWYVEPESENKFYLRDGNAAYDIMRATGLGITNTDLAKIPIGVQDKIFGLKDSDGDGIPDNAEGAIGTDATKNDSDGDGVDDKTALLQGFKPQSQEKYVYDSVLVERVKGKILLQVESAGEAWYVHPEDNLRYYLGDPDSSFNIMRFLSLGITNEDLHKIPVGEFEE